MAPRKPIPEPIKCGGTAKHTGKRCKRWAIPGSNVCKHHGAYGGSRGGRAAAEDRHAARRIEALVTAQVGRAMEEAGFPAALVEAAAAGTLDIPSFRPSQAREEAEDEAAFLAMSSRLAVKTVAAFQTVAARLTDQATAPPPVQRAQPFTFPVLSDLPVLDGEVVEDISPPMSTPHERDRVAEEIERLEARPTARRAAEAARLRHQREVMGAVPDRHTEPESEPTRPTPEPPPAPPPARPGRRTTTLGTGRGGTITLPGGRA